MSINQNIKLTVINKKTNETQKYQASNSGYLTNVFEYLREHGANNHNTTIDYKLLGIEEDMGVSIELVTDIDATLPTGVSSDLGDLVVVGRSICANGIIEIMREIRGLVLINDNHFFSTDSVMEVFEQVLEIVKSKDNDVSADVFKELLSRSLFSMKAVAEGNSILHRFAIIGSNDDVARLHAFLLSEMNSENIYVILSGILLDECFCRPN